MGIGRGLLRLVPTRTPAPHPDHVDVALLVLHCARDAAEGIADLTGPLDALTAQLRDHPDQPEVRAVAALIVGADPQETR